MKNETITLMKSEAHLPIFFRWLLNLSEIVLPKYLRTSHQHVLIVWLTLLTFACGILLFLIYCLYYREERPSYSLLHPLYPEYSSNLVRRPSITHFEQPVQPIFIEPHPYRYARIKRLSSPKKFDADFLTGHFRTIIQFQSLPD